MSSPVIDPADTTRRGSAAERDAARRRRLLDVGLEVFGSIGYSNSAIESICARAQVGTHSFYAEFSSKEDLLVAVYDAIVERLAERAQEALGSEPTDLADHIAAGIRATVDETRADERAARVRLLEVVGVSARLEEHRRAVLHRFADLIRADSERMSKLGLVGRPVSPIRAMALVGATNELFIDWVLAPKRFTRDELIAELTHVYLAVLGG